MNDELIEAICEIDGAFCNLQVVLKTEEQIPLLKTHAISDLEQGIAKLQKVWQESRLKNEK